MSLKAVRVFRSVAHVLVLAVLTCVGILAVAMFCPLPAHGQTVGDALAVADRTAAAVHQTAMSDDGLVRLALQVAILCLLLIGFLVWLFFRLMSKTVVAIDRLTSRPCLADPEDLAEFLRTRAQQHAKGGGAPP